MKLRLLVSYIKHLLEAKNRHGLHSPFVYQLLDEVIYNYTDLLAYVDPERMASVLPPDSDRPNSTKVNRLLYRLLHHFKPATFAIADNVNTITNMYLQLAAPNANQINWEQAIYNDDAICLVCDAANLPLRAEAFKPGTIVMVTNIYDDEAATTFWQQVQQHPGINVTVDLFWLGLAFARPTQADEHFKLRF